MLPGGTIFVGDSITVGLPPFVSVDAPKTQCAKGGASSAAIFGLLKAEESKGGLDNVKNMVVLAGTNDIGSGLSALQIFTTIQEIWKIGKARGMNVIAMTIPPAIGALTCDENKNCFSTWRGNDVGVDNKRRIVNTMISSVGSGADRVINLDVMLGNDPDNGRLSVKFDGGDHLHPKKDVMGKALTEELGKPVVSARNSISQFFPSVNSVGSSVGYAAGAIGIGWLTLKIWEKLKSRL